MAGRLPLASHSIPLTQMLPHDDPFQLRSATLPRHSCLPMFRLTLTNLYTNVMADGPGCVVSNGSTKVLALHRSSACLRHEIETVQTEHQV